MKTNEFLTGYEAALADAEAGQLPSAYAMKTASARYRRGYAAGRQDYTLTH